MLILLLFYGISAEYSVSYGSEQCATPGIVHTPYTSIIPNGPVIDCNILPDEFVECAEPLPVPTFSPQVAHGGAQMQENTTTNSEEGRCSKMGGQRAEDIEHTWVKCRALACIECRGERTFKKKVPCIKYSGHYFLSTLLYSIFLGIIAVDRFCLGYSAMAVGKLMTLGGFGVWWIVDIFLLVFGVLVPADDSNWEPNY